MNISIITDCMNMRNVFSCASVDSLCAMLFIFVLIVKCALKICGSVRCAPSLVNRIICICLHSHTYAVRVRIRIFSIHSCSWLTLRSMESVPIFFESFSNPSFNFSFIRFQLPVFFSSVTHFFFHSCENAQIDLNRISSCRLLITSYSRSSGAHMHAHRRIEQKISCSPLVIANPPDNFIIIKMHTQMQKMIYHISVCIARSE